MTDRERDIVNLVDDLLMAETVEEIIAAKNAIYGAWQAAQSAPAKQYKCGCSASPEAVPDYCPIHDISHTGRMLLPVEPSHGGISVAPIQSAQEPTAEMIEAGVAAESAVWENAQEWQLLSTIRSQMVAAAYKAMIAASKTGGTTNVD